MGEEDSALGQLGEYFSHDDIYTNILETIEKTKRSRSEDGCSSNHDEDLPLAAGERIERTFNTLIDAPR
jgi:hypothetical protein